MIHWLETASPTEYSVGIWIGAFWVLASLCLARWAASVYYDKHPEKTLGRYNEWPERAKLAISVVLPTSISTWGFSVYLADSSNLHAGVGSPWNETYGSVYKTCSEEGKPIADCRKVAKDTANHYRNK